MLEGRDPQLQRIDAGLTAAREGRSFALLVHGEPGIGKSALLEEAVARATGFRVLRALGTAPAREGPRGARLRAFVVSLPWGPALLALGLAVAIGGWWWVRNEALYGALQPNGWATNPPRREPLLLPDSFWTWFVYFAATMCNRFWAGLGMFEPPQLTPVAIVGASVVAWVMGVACLVTGFGPGRSRLPVPAQAAPGGAPAPPRRSWRERLIGAVWRVAPPAVMLAPVVFPYVTVGQRSWAEYERYTRGIAVQGRYLYMGIVGVGVVIALGMARLLGRRRERWTPLVLLVGALLMQAFALLAICSYYWLGRGVNLTPARVPDAAAAIARWAPFPVGVTFTIMIATGLAVVLALVVVARSAAHDRPGPAAPGMATAAVASPPGAALPAVPSPPASSSTTSPSPTGM